MPNAQDNFTSSPWRVRLLFSARACSLSALLAFQASPSLAQSDALLQARERLEAREPAAAFNILSPHEAERAGDPAFDYLLGISALDSGHPTRAIFALERVLAMQPENNLARAEIARAYLLAGEVDTARDELVAARRGPMPAEAAAAIDRVLSELSQPGSGRSARAVSGYLELGLGHDSNINSATSTSEFALPEFGGLILKLDPGNRERSSAFATAGAGLNIYSPVNADLALVGALHARLTHHAATSTFNPSQLDASVGLAHARGANTFTGALQFGHTRIDGDAYRTAAGVSGQWQRNLTPTLQVASFFQVARVSYDNQTLRNVQRYVGGLGFVRSLDSGERLVYGSTYAVRENPVHQGIPHVGHGGVGARLGGEWQTGALTWFTQGQMEARRYGGTEPYFGARRADDQMDASVGVHWQMSPAWRLTPQLMHTRNRSSIVIFSYDRTVLQLMAQRKF